MEINDINDDNSMLLQDIFFNVKNKGILLDKKENLFSFI